MTRDKVSRAKTLKQEKRPANDPSINYFPPSKGPFRCSNCEYFMGDGKPCQKVSDPVESSGCCNAFDN